MTDSSEKPRDPHLVALGALLRERRKASGLTHTQAATAGRMSVAQIQRIEAGSIDTGGTGLLLLMEAVGVSMGEALAILHDPDPTPEKARQLAEGEGQGATRDELAGLVEEIARDAAGDAGLIEALGGFLAGRRSRAG